MTDHGTLREIKNFENILQQLKPTMLVLFDFVLEIKLNLDTLHIK
jgi:hypothetical protein